MYQPDTILTLKEPRSTDDEPFPYDRVRVVGQSPINHGLTDETWVGANGQGVIIEPIHSFGSTTDEPFGKLQELYDVESIPEVEAVAPVTVKTVPPEAQGPSPEDVFASEAAKEGKDSRRVKPVEPPKSPLDKPPVRGAEEEVAPEATDG